MKSIIEITSTGYCACIEELDGVGVAARTIHAVKRDLEKALRMHIEGMKEDGELPKFLEDPENLELTHSVDVETFFQCYAGILTKSGIAKIAGINQSLMSQYAMGLKKPRAKQIKKLEESLHDLGKDLMAIRF